MNRTTASILVLALTAAIGTTSVSAQQYGNGPGRHDNHRNVPDDTRRDVGQVTRVVRYSDPYRDYQREQCWNESSNRYDDDYYRDQNGRLYRDDGRNNTTGTIVGALVGGALGNQVGKGDGRKAATVAGAVIGGAIGRNVDRNDGDHNNYRDGDRAFRGDDGVVRRCRMVEGRGNRNRRDGFDVTYRYGGQIYQTWTSRNPGRTIRVLVDVRPQADEIRGGR